ncbi:hypothetical protein ACLMJK_002838 [Lecanora helva]
MKEAPGPGFEASSQHKKPKSDHPRATRVEKPARSSVRKANKPGISARNPNLDPRLETQVATSNPLAIELETNTHPVTSAKDSSQHSATREPVTSHDLFTHCHSFQIAPSQAVAPAQGGTPVQVGTLDDFHPNWTPQVGLTTDEVVGVKSHLSLDSLYYAHAIRVGDIIKVQVQLGGDSSDHPEMLSLKMIGDSHEDLYGRRLPDFSASVPNLSQTRVPDIKTCKSPQQIAKNLRDYGISVCSPSNKLWDNMSLYREGMELGSLKFVRAAFQLWRNHKDDEAAQAGLVWRPRFFKRPKNESGVFGSKRSSAPDNHNSQ